MRKSKKHEVTPECKPIHCKAHNVDELPFLSVHRSCPSCHHFYASTRALRRAFRWRLYIEWKAELTNFKTLWRMLSLTTKKAYWCPFCFRDFDSPA